MQESIHLYGVLGLTLQIEQVDHIIHVTQRISPFWPFPAVCRLQSSSVAIILLTFASVSSCMGG